MVENKVTCFYSPRCKFVSPTATEHDMNVHFVVMLNKKPSCCWDSRSYCAHRTTYVRYGCRTESLKCCVWNGHGHVTTLLMATPDADISAVRFSPRGACGVWKMQPTAIIIAKRYILQLQKCPKKWIGSALLETRRCNFQLSTPTLSAGHNAQHCRKADDSVVTRAGHIILHAVVRSANKNALHVWSETLRDPSADRVTLVTLAQALMWIYM